LTKEVTSQTEEFLESIYRLQERDGAARTSELVKMLNIVPGTVTNTVERLERRGLIKHEAYRGVKLTEGGRAVALRVLRRHRLSERLLSDVLRMRWDRIHEAACQLEHGVTEEVADNIEKILGQPMTCPHGNPIPTLNGEIAGEDSAPLSSLRMNEEAVVSNFVDESPRTLERIWELGLKPQARIRLLDVDLKKRILIVQTGGAKRQVPLQLASTIKVRKAKAENRMDAD
jgi:DtxR family Mn-dependent transcriptional regulator